MNCAVHSDGTIMRKYAAAFVRVVLPENSSMKHKRWCYAKKSPSRLLEKYDILVSLDSSLKGASIVETSQVTVVPVESYKRLNADE
jgi:hypothetical protein